MNQLGIFCLHWQQCRQQELMFYTNIQDYYALWTITNKEKVLALLLLFEPSFRYFRSFFDFF